jgi:hypothetical protein
LPSRHRDTIDRRARRRQGSATMSGS